jgi:polar amino acid transport system substrate-binding protein
MNPFGVVSFIKEFPFNSLASKLVAAMCPVSINKIRILVLVAFVVVCGFQFTAIAQDDSREDATILRVGVYESPPFVMADGDSWAGMAIDLWEELANELNLRYSYVPFTSDAELVEKASTGEIDVAVSNITITEARHRKVLFTQPWFDAGLRLMVPTSGATGFFAVLEGLKDAGYLRSYAWLALIVLVGTLVLTLFDRTTDPEFPKRWREGIAESFYSVMSIATSGKVPSRKNRWGWLGRVGQAFWLFSGVAILAYVTSTVTSVMTMLTLTGQIKSVADMSTRVSGVLQGSTAEDYVKEKRMKYQVYSSLTAAAEAMEARKVDAVIGDAPVLEYFLQQNPAIPARMSGAIFKPEKYAFGASPDSNLRRGISVELTAAQERGKLEALRLKYFGPRQ